MPDCGFGRCDGHHEMVGFRLEKKQRNGRVVDFRRLPLANSLGASPRTCSPLGGPPQEFALNLSAKRRLCNTLGGRFIDGTAGCCAVSSALSRAATMTNFARSSLVLVLRAFHGGAKSCSLVNFFMICPPVGW
jgi:hypothetical protein